MWTSLSSQFYDSNEKTSYWYYEKGEAIPAIVKLKQVFITYIELIQENNTKNNLPSGF